MSNGFASIIKIYNLSFVEGLFYLSLLEDKVLWSKTFLEASTSKNRSSIIIIQWISRKSRVRWNDVRSLNKGYYYSNLIEEVERNLWNLTKPAQSGNLNGKEKNRWGANSRHLFRRRKAVFLKRIIIFADFLFKIEKLFGTTVCILFPWLSRHLAWVLYIAIGESKNWRILWHFVKK